MSQVTLEAIQAKQTELAAMIQQLQTQPGRIKLIEIESCDIELQPGEHYAGAIVDENGEHLHHLILMAQRPTGKLNWQAATDCGQEQEPFARQAYETTTGFLVQEAGFAFTDCGMFGLSVDGLVGDDGVIEIKTMVGSDNLFETVVEEDYSEYLDQCLGYLLFLDRKWVDLILWTPDLEDKGLGLVIHRINRADHLEAIAALKADLDAFAGVVREYEAKLRTKAAANVDLLRQAA